MTTTHPPADTFPLTSAVSCGRFRANGKWLDLNIRPLDTNGSSIRTVEHYPMPSEKLSSFMEDVVFTVKNTGEYCRDLQLQFLLSNPCLFEISALNGRVKIIDKQTARPWDVSDAAVLRRSPSDPTRFDQPTKLGGIAYLKLSDLAQELLETMQGGPAITSGPTNPEPNFLSLPSVELFSQLDSQKISLPVVRDWCKKTLKPGPDTVIGFESFKARIRQDYQGFQQGIQQIVQTISQAADERAAQRALAEARKGLTELLHPLAAIKTSLDRQLNQEKDTAKQALLRLKLASINQLIAMPNSNESAQTFLQSELIQRNVFEELVVLRLVQNYSAEHPEGKPLCDELLKDDLLKNRIHEAWESEIFATESLWSSWKKSFTVQNIAGVALATAAALFFPPITATSILGAGYLAYKNIEKIDQYLLSHSTNENPGFIRQITTEARKIGVIAAAGLAVAALSTLLAPTTIAISLTIGTFAPGYVEHLNPLLQQIPFAKNHTTLAKIALIATGAAFCSGATPVVLGISALGGILGGVLALKLGDPQTKQNLKKALVGTAISILGNNAVGEAVSSILGDTIFPYLFHEKIKWLALPLIGATIPLAIGNLIPWAARSLIPMIGRQLFPFSLPALLSVLPMAILSPFLQKKLASYFPNLSDMEKWGISMALVYGINFLSLRLFGGGIAGPAGAYLAKTITNLMVPSGWLKQAGMVYFMLVGKHLIKHGSLKLHQINRKFPAMSEKASYFLTAVIWGMLANSQAAIIAFPAKLAWKTIAGTTLAKTLAAGAMCKIIGHPKISASGKVNATLLLLALGLSTQVQLHAPLRLIATALFGNIPSLIFGTLSSFGLSAQIDQKLSLETSGIAKTALIAIMNLAVFWQMRLDAGRFYWKAAALSASHALSAHLQTAKNQPGAPMRTTAQFWGTQLINFYLPFLLGIFSKHPATLPSAPAIK